jgi:hypothetical protein
MCPVLPVTSPPLLVQEGRSPSTRLCDAVRSGPVGADHQAPLGVGRNRSVPSRCECVRVAPFQYEDVEGASRTETALPTRQCIKGGSGADGSWSRRRARICSARTAVQTSTIPCCSTASAAAAAASRSLWIARCCSRHLLSGRGERRHAPPLRYHGFLLLAGTGPRRPSRGRATGRHLPRLLLFLPPVCRRAKKNPSLPAPTTGPVVAFRAEAVGRKFTLGRPPPRARQ